MRLMIVILVIVLALVVDYSWYKGRYTQTVMTAVEQGIRKLSP